MRSECFLLAQNIKKLRHAREWSQAELSIAANVSIGTIQRIESPEFNFGYSPRLFVLDRLSSVFNIEIYALFVNIPFEYIADKGLFTMIENYAVCDRSERLGIERIAAMELC